MAIVYCLRQPNFLGWRSQQATLSRQNEARSNFTWILCAINHHLIQPNRLLSSKRVGQRHQFGKGNLFKPKTDRITFGLHTIRGDTQLIATVV